MTVRRILRGAAALAFTATAVLTGAAQAQAEGGTWDGCPYGAVCIYPENVTPVNNPHPSHIFYSYGFHRVYNQFGNHWVFNNQYDGAVAELCRSVNTDCTESIPSQQGWYVDMTPINSLHLREHYQ
ncbi:MULTISPECIES: hypothetical protein [Streptomyces]|uniref:hypothetical protein n=1 Tax=Streptomyces TaxID=1883 RepID=UPI000D514826|nr:MULTISPECIES: hypothetical protein [Streptomyces]PVC62087.1 hypothetical protein DBP15_31880 [Streptomyces sp. CS065A]